LEEAHRDIGLPMVALIGSETPSRLQAMLARQPSAFLMKPIRSTGIYASLAIATHQYATFQTMRRKLASAEERLRSRRLLLAATLQIMNQAQVSEAEAFRILRRAAMSNRQTVEAVSAQILAGDLPLPRLLAG
jgi:AmiR/NasT family two-component response regulator